jgi:hypothetical protein
MSEAATNITANCFLALLCCGWPGLCAFVAFNLGRHGASGWWRQIVYRLKAFGAQEVE